MNPSSETSQNDTGDRNNASHGNTDPALAFPGDAAAARGSLPLPKRADRWQALRSGVLNLYRYDYEEFHFEDGRLLLRGNNGSGKSRVLALQLPFLLDGEVSPARLEPDGDPAKRVEWNLLLGKYPERTGYTWVEFGRRAEDGTLQFLTLGCGLRAVSGQTGLHSRWFFITKQRIGQDLFLQSAQRTPLGRDRLAEAIGAQGRIITKTEEYRRAVDEALFGLGPRFGPLLDLLVRLRRPQLSRKLDEDELSGALSDALPTLPDAIVNEVAESFSTLQSDRETLRGFVAARDAVAAFLREYATYVRIAVRRRATAVRSAHAAYEAAQRAARDAELRLTEADSALAALATLRSELDQQLVGAESTERTLRESPEMRTADEIRLAGETAASTARAFTLAEEDVQRAAAALAQATQREARAAAQTQALTRTVEQKLRDADAAALAADLATTHREHVPTAETALAVDASWANTAEPALRRELTRRDRAITTIRERERAVDLAQQRFATADEARRRAEEAASAAREADHAAHQALAAEGAQFLARYAAWREANSHLRAEFATALADELATWLEQRLGPSPLRRSINAAREHALGLFATRDIALTTRTGEIATELGEIAAAIAGLETGDVIPPAPLTRRADRTGRPGAPLWRVCDFRDEVSAASHAGLEAALQAAGLLDAWLLPDGRLLSGTEDTFLLSELADAPLPQHHLGEALVVAIDAADNASGLLDVEQIARTLRRIGLGSGAGRDWVNDQGGWQLGPLGGCWTKPSAEYVGASARAAARRRQLLEFRARQTQLETERGQLQQAHAALANDRAAAAAEYEKSPTDEPTLRAGYTLETATRAVADTLATSERAAREAAIRHSEREERQRDRDRDAADLKLSEWLGRLDELARHLQTYAAALASLWPSLSHWQSITAQLAGERELTATAAAEHVSRLHRREAAAADASATKQRFETLQETHGQEISVVLARLAVAEREVKRIKAELHASSERQLEQTAAQTKARDDRAHAEDQRQTREEHRRAAIASLQHFAELRLLGEADVALREIEPAGWSVSRAVEVARAIEPVLADAPDDDENWRRRQDSIHGYIQDLRDRLIRHGHQPETHSLEDLVLVRCVFQSRPHTMTELQAAFAGELDARDRLLQAREREIIENHLLAEVTVELRRLIRAAEDWRVSANQELSTRPTSSGVRFRFQWEADSETRFNDVRPVLLRRGELWSPLERSALGTFLQQRIAAEQTADETGSWRDHLARALDYRRWHRFVIERQQDGQWRRLDSRTYGTGSGGEKALALTLPRFAAAAAHYRAAPSAPRLVMLDEAFAGIDPTMRGQCMGVLTQFDLDVIMTSELEWGCYPTVPALAIYHLTTLPGIDAVGASRWLWNGREKRQRDPVLPPAAAPESANEGGDAATPPTMSDDQERGEN